MMVGSCNPPNQFIGKTLSILARYLNRTREKNKKKLPSFVRRAVCGFGKVILAGFLVALSTPRDYNFIPHIHHAKERGG